MSLRIQHKYVWNWAKCLGLAFLVMNLAIASIPRCDFIFKLMDAVTSSEPVSRPHISLSCHEAKESQLPSKADAFTSKRFCGCNLLSFVGFTLVHFDHSSYIRFLVQSERLLDFRYARLPADLSFPPVPPYPKTV